ncbi:DUF3375 domain-containing protein [Leucobacter sp. W1478]|uniref:DUF3375 domain-containing protein n=1 Tax=Leucobacter sp. W1478 TaxID=3439065 RepID=UPI003F2ADE9B
MAVLPGALAIKRLLAHNDTLRMLRADTLPLIASTLSEHLGKPGTKLLTDELHERLDADLVTLREHFALGDRSAKSYCDEWRGKGLLIRRTSSAARGETYELSAAGLDAIRIVEQLISPRSTLTESRLMVLAQALHGLAVDTDPDTTRKLRSLREERDRIDAEIERISRGAAQPLDPRAATERITDVLAQAESLPADFARVRARFEELNHELRTAILDLDERQTTVISEIFRGVDLIASADEGRTFSAFSSLIRDPESSARFEADVHEILGREFAQELPAPTRRAIRNLLRDMKTGSRDVQDTLTEFARGLRRYVRSQEYERDRALRTLIQQALAAAVPSRTAIKPYASVGMTLELSTLPMTSVGELSPHDPSDYAPSATLGDAEHGEIDLVRLTAIARESEIDFDELIGHVNEALERQGPVSVGEVLSASPATQGLASVIGLLALATRHGTLHDEEETLAWQGLDERTRSARVPRHAFTERIDT